MNALLQLLEGFPEKHRDLLKSMNYDHQLLKELPQ